MWEPESRPKGTADNDLIGAQLDALERWIDYRQSRGTKGASAPPSLGGYARSLIPDP